MTQKLFTIDEALWRPSVACGKEDVTLNTITDITVIKGGDPQFFFGDGDIYSQFAWVENMTQAIRLTAADFSERVDTDTDAGEDNSLASGDTGVLELKFPQRASGMGGQSTVASSCLKALCGGPEGTGVGEQDSGCVIGNINNAAQQTGIGNVQYDFNLTSMDGTTTAIALSMTTLS